MIDRVVAARTQMHQPDTGVLDPAAIMRACGEDGAILEKICQAFQASAPNQMARVRSALNDKDAMRLAKQLTRCPVRWPPSQRLQVWRPRTLKMKRHADKLKRAYRW